jgi:hypothetical protein
MLIFWNLPIHSDGRYLATSIGSRESGYSYFRSAAEATDNLDYANASLPTGTLPRRSRDRRPLSSERKPERKSLRPVAELNQTKVAK